ncbi:transposase [Cellulosimicrobium protaetiae]|uniref:transposase n=1 Tax=Cellulosimicrobium protaetiae TaxID=2587808 RepID=UPI0020A4BD1B|nr:transposase [Cellulosimicrobium protaetiae]
MESEGPSTFATDEALTRKVRETGRVINAVVLVATGENGDGHGEVLTMRVATSETGAASNEFFADLVARGLAGVEIVKSDARGPGGGHHCEPAQRDVWQHNAADRTEIHPQRHVLRVMGHST